MRTNNIKAKIDKTQGNSKSRMGGKLYNNIKAKTDKTQRNSTSRMSGKAVNVNHLLRECSKVAQKKYKRRNDWFGTKIPC